VSFLRRALFIAALVIGGEIVFGLPFHITRFFRPTFLEVFGFNNTQLGDIFAIYGITATLSFFPGGVLADYFSARKLIMSGLFATAAGGLYMATIPTASSMAVLYGYFGVTTIFLSWGAMIRATREWGGESAQGVAFGILEAGRGLAAVIVAFVAVNALAQLLPEVVAASSDEQRRAGLRAVIHVYALAAFAAGVLTWFAVPDTDARTLSRRKPWSGVAEVLKRPQIWAQAIIIVAAYCLFKGTDYYSLYAKEVLGFNEVAAARITTWGALLRVVAALAAGILADRFNAASSIGVAFAALVASFGVLAVLTPASVGVLLIICNVLVSLFAVFALRGVYYALLEEIRTPRQITGTAVGVVSFIGFTPDIFFASLAGRILDADPGIVGYRHLFMLLAAIAAVGVLVVLWLQHLQRSRRWLALADERGNAVDSA